MRYAQGMGVSVRFKPYNKSGNRAEWALDGSEITIYTFSGESKVSQILSLIHEIGHHRGWIENGRKIDPKVEEAINDEEEKKMNRKRIYLDEVKDTDYWEQIYADCDCKFNIGKLHKQKELDIWTYEVYYETGKFPKNAETKEKTKELTKKYGC